MIEFLTIVLAALGLLYILQYGTILDRPRKFVNSRCQFLKELIECSQCLGFWTGLFVCFVYNVFVQGQFTMTMCFKSVLFGFAISFLGKLFDLVMGVLDEAYFFIKTKNEKP